MERNICIDQCIARPYDILVDGICFEHTEPPDKTISKTNSDSKFITSKFDKKYDSFGFPVLLGCEQETNPTPEHPNFNNPNIELITITVDGDRTGSDKGSWHPVLSEDGRSVAIASVEDELVEEDNNNFEDIFVYDTLSKKFELISVSSAGKQANNWSTFPSISGNGQFVSFTSTASNLVEGDDNGMTDIFLYNRGTKKIEKVSSAPNGGDSNGNSHVSRISSDGRFVAFNSSATNLVPFGKDGIDDVFIYNVETKKVSKASTTDEGFDSSGSSGSPSINFDGSIIAFGSWADNLVAKDSNDAYDIFLRDIINDAIQRISVPLTSKDEANGNSSWPVISSDGRYVAFQSKASNLVKGDKNKSWDVFVYDTTEHKTARCSIGGDGNSEMPSISGNGQFVAFSSSAALTPDDTNDVDDVYVCDIKNDKIARVSVEKGDAEGANKGTGLLSISSDGRFIAFNAGSFTYHTADNGYDNFIDVFLAKNPLYVQNEGE